MIHASGFMNHPCVELQPQKGKSFMMGYYRALAVLMNLDEVRKFVKMHEEGAFTTMDSRPLDPGGRLKVRREDMREMMVTEKWPHEKPEDDYGEESSP